VVVRQETRFPEEDATHLTLALKEPARLALRVRYPSWAQSGMTLTINGKAETVAAAPQSYATVDREWKNGDRIDVRLPMSLHTEAMPDDPNMIAIMYGPIVLAGDLGREGLEGVKRYGPSAPPVGRVKTPVIPVFVGEVKGVTSKIEAISGTRLHFTTRGLAQPHEVTLLPFYQVVDQRYSVYWNVLSPAAWEKRKADRAALDARRKDVEQHTIDKVVVDEAENERQHGYRGENATEGYFEGRRTREARGGWFSYDLKIVPDRPVTLVCAYRGSEGRRRAFDILVNGQKVVSESLEYHPTEQLDREYALPETLTRGKDRVTVKFQAEAQATAGAGIEIRSGAWASLK